MRDSCLEVEEQRMMNMLATLLNTHGYVLSSRLICIMMNKMKRHIELQLNKESMV